MVKVSMYLLLFFSIMATFGIDFQISFTRNGKGFCYDWSFDRLVKNTVNLFKREKQED